MNKMRYKGNEKEYMKEYWKRWYEKNKEKKRKQVLEWSLKNQDKVKLIKQRADKIYKEKHKDRLNEYQKRYRLNNSEKLKAYYKKWILQNKDKIQIISERRYKKDIIKVFARHYDKNKKEKKCKFCDSNKNLEFHHINYEKREGFTLCKNCHRKEHKE